MSEPDVPRLSVVIPVLNDADGLGRCLSSIDAGRSQSDTVEIIVADNGSTDDSVAVAQTAGCRVLSLPGLRVGELRNRAAAAARSTLLAFIDADHEILSGWIDAACSVLAEDGVAGAGAVCLAPTGGTWVQLMYGRLRGIPSGRHDVDWLGSGNMALRQDVFRQLGGFDTTLAVCEDVDLCQRIRRAGWRLVSDDRMGSVHHGDPRGLRALFASEMWRARDNLRVSLRRLTFRGLPSVVIPVLDFACLALALCGLATVAWGGLPLAGIAACVFLTVTLLRTARILASPGDRGPLAWMRAFAVAVTYDAARALALVFTVRHRRTDRRAS